ncbi:1-acylglycerol-3-phosphate O-acyltransferase [Photobacterium angustum]|uniref:1-acyl-sn-glycerol-3-phosphate acyltransferase n=1 Tax=Photobacterium angustum TaxID=661 RepID=A0A855SDQ1_PHOAN|nr:1-acylglycerol-3-phosphate O-acyltransferase [Photobacterium angustum]KJF80823.1 acyl-phosphate glycerol 3-phosphate acyltransferase [Photobacterium damselae subsp. damselae]KJG16467.1 acyl-phosphate glycerol 3-phosphate acyltransferase [Photobacterium angustum]KJG22582.1 acyl-phosphate glycerol 3-phosphate acyltransferase [Photobacterium angustum]KJG29450.1 acyl-phosphate glycerol 3-phosphate acyltransferase [Photobacterium angustum]KJG38395.1 acyl-phosphate glycerol 3-phosphate acyltransf
MLAFIRIIIATLFIIITTFCALLYCLINRPRAPKHVYTFCRWFNQLQKIIGVRVEQRGLVNSTNITNAVYISNHQSVYDFVTTPGMLQPNTVSLGKKSLLWIPFFGQLYWITGNILIDRENKAKARNTIQQVADAIHQRNLSVWVYPEGTRSKGRGLLPFKTGAFRMAIEAGVPIIPVVISTTHNKIDLNKLDNGTVIAEMLAPINTQTFKSTDARQLAEQCHQLMAEKIAQLDNELKQDSYLVSEETSKENKA